MMKAGWSARSVACRPGYMKRSSPRLPGATAVRYLSFRNSEHRQQAVSIADVEQHAFGFFAGHFSWAEVDNEQGLPALDFRFHVAPFLFHAGQNDAPVIAEID